MKMLKRKAVENFSRIYQVCEQFIPKVLGTENLKHSDFTQYALFVNP
jgi:hypothetical protein